MKKSYPLCPSSYDDFDFTTQDESDVLLTEQIQELLVENHRVLFMQEKNQKYFDDWVNGGVYDLGEDVYKAIEMVMERVEDGKLVLRSFAYIHAVVRSNYTKRTGTQSVEAMVGELTKNLRGF